jgi:hypothetical protein
VQQVSDWKRHDQFKVDLGLSRPWVLLAAERAKLKGYHVQIPDEPVAEEYEDRKPDYGDFLMRKPGEIRWLRMEVKKLSTSFTCAADWPHGRFFICNMKAWDRAEHKPDGFIYFDADASHIATLDGDTHLEQDLWKQDENVRLFDKVLGKWYTQGFYFLDSADRVHFEPWEQ